MHANHYPLSPTIQLCRSTYRHNKAASYAAYLRRLGFDATRVESRVEVYHAAAVEPDAKRSPSCRTLLSPINDNGEFLRALNAHVGFTLRSAGFLPIEKVSPREYMSPDTHVKFLLREERGQNRPLFPARAHLCWRWDIEHHSGRIWIVPLPSRRFLSSYDPNHPVVSKWLLQRARMGKRIKGLDLATGKHRSLEHCDGKWGQVEPGGWKPLEGSGWRVTLDMEALKDLGYSEKAYNSAQFTFEDLWSILHSSSPLASVVATLESFEVPSDRTGEVSGSHLRFARGLGREPREVLKLGVLEGPSHPVQVTVVASRKESIEEDRTARLFLNAHLAAADKRKYPRMREASKAVGDKDTIATIWSKKENGLSLLPFDTVNKVIHEYDAKTGHLSEPSKLATVAQQAQAEGRTLIALVLVDDQVDKNGHDELMKNFRGLRALPLKSSSLTPRKGYSSWINLTLMLAQKAGAVPWRLERLPGVDGQTVFVGVDLGHDHQADRSNLAMTLIDHHGRPIASKVLHLSRNDERIAVGIIARELPRLLYGQHRDFAQVIIHRDGRYMEGEIEEITNALRSIPRLTLICIKKDTRTRLADAELEGAYFQLSQQRALLVTNAQARHRSMPAPIEIELAVPDDQTLDDAVAQVFWLSRVCQGSAYHPRRLPVTTGWANNIATTGKKIHLKGWDAWGK